VDSWSSGFVPIESMAATIGGPQVDVELVGPHLRVGGRIGLGRFGRLSDRVNHARGFVLMHDARLLKRNGDPTPLVVPELFVNQDEITFIGVAHAGIDDQPPQTAGAERQFIPKQPRRYVVFTPGHSISGSMHVHEQMTLENFVDASDPRFIPMTEVTARSLADRRVVSRFDFLLINRTQMTAIAEADRVAHGPEGVEIEIG
jgi:hypothetical protein